MRKINEFAQPCKKCGLKVHVGEGFVYPTPHDQYSWSVYHAKCDSRNGTAIQSPNATVNTQIKASESLMTF